MKTNQAIPDLIASVMKYVIIIVLVMFCISKAKEAYGLGYSIFSPTAADSPGRGHDVTVTVSSDMSVSDVGKLLKEKGLVNDALVFRIQELFSDAHGKICPGTYTLNTEMLPQEILDILSADYE